MFIADNCIIMQRRKDESNRMPKTKLVTVTFEVDDSNDVHERIDKQGYTNEIHLYQCMFQCAILGQESPQINDIDEATEFLQEHVTDVHVQEVKDGDLD